MSAGTVLQRDELPSFPEGLGDRLWSGWGGVPCASCKGTAACCWGCCHCPPELSPIPLTQSPCPGSGTGVCATHVHPRGGLCATGINPGPRGGPVRYPGGIVRVALGGLSVPLTHGGSRVCGEQPCAPRQRCCQVPPPVPPAGVISARQLE